MTQQNTPTDYHPERLLDTLQHILQLRSDEELARRLHVAPRIIREIRAGMRPVGASMLIWMAEATGVGVPELRKLMGDRRRTCRVSIGPVKPRAQSAAPDMPPRAETTQGRASP